jgi:hypothetical protein
MRIRGTCANCGREFLPEQVVSAGGHCPWCGKAFNRDYTAMLVKHLERADEAGEVLEDSLEQIAGIDELAMEIDEDSVVEPLREALRAIKRRRART